MRTRKQKKRTNLTMKLNTNINYIHDLNVNSYISHAFNKMMENKTIPEKKKYLYLLIHYCFSNITTTRCKELSELVYTFIDDYKTDYEICKMIFYFIKSLKKENTIGYSMSNNDYLQSKINQMEKVITKKLLQNQQHTILIDIGAGDCAISSLLGKYNNMEAIAVDIKDEIDWGSSSIKTHCDLVNHIYYDGTRLLKTIKNEITKKRINKEVGLIMYNHSLHHFGNYENIKHSLSESYKLLNKGGILFIREHDNNSNDIDINLQHIFISIQYSINHNIEWNLKKIWDYTNNFMKTYTSHFFSKKYIIDLCEKTGFKLINVKRPNTDISKTTLYAFIK